AEQQRRRSQGIATSFGLSALASLGLAVVYVAGGQVQLEGILLGVALGGLAVGLILWARHLMPGGHFVQEREQTLGTPAERAAVIGSFERGEELIERRGLLGKLLGAAIGALGLAALFPIRSLGTSPGRSLFTTEWREGIRLVTLDDAPVRPEDLDVGGVLTVFPEGAVEPADSQTLLIRLDEGEYDPLPGREDWGPQDLVAFSKVCTHAGCPVGLYQPTGHELFCPCHQSVFNVLQAATPTAGPATRPLPQLPLALDDDGYLVARSDYTEPIGPGFWSRPRG
ncbi:MAG: Rieske 2Fe-2S domain-containing protein, partial [Actinomycetota bacterium]